MQNTLDLVRMLGEVARIANESDHTVEAVARSLHRLCAAGRWDVGHAYLAEDASGTLQSVGFWEGGNASPGFLEFRSASEALRIEPGKGWLGRVLLEGRPRWIVDIGRATDFRRAGSATRAGFRTGLGIPVVAESRVIGVVELFSRASRGPEPRVTELGVHLGEVLGSVFRREESRKELDAALQRFRALFSLLPVPAVVLSLPAGRYAEVNRRFEETFGYTRSEVLGRSDVDLGLWADPTERELLLDRIPRAPDYVASEVHLRDRTGRTVVGLATVTRISWDGAPHALGMMLDLSERIETERLLEKRRGEVEFLVERLLGIQEEERSRLARELHDGIGQTLTALKLKIGELMHAEPAARQRLTGEAIEVLNDALEGARTLSFDLRPAMLDELGLSNAIRAYATRQSAAGGLEVDLQVRDLDAEPSGEVQTACYRILQEAVTNVLRHAYARRLGVRVVAAPAGFELRVDDDGKGFRPEGEGGHLGLLIMRERAALVDGEVEVRSSPGKGTSVVARFPFQTEALA